MRSCPAIDVLVTWCRVYIPCSSIPRRNKPRRVDLYYSSWCIRAGSHFPCLLCLRLGNNRSCITEKYEIPFLSVSVGSYLIQNFLLTCIGTVESKRGNGGLTACEILLFHHQDMGMLDSLDLLGVDQWEYSLVLEESTVQGRRRARRRCPERQRRSRGRVVQDDGGVAQRPSVASGVGDVLAVARTLASVDFPPQHRPSRSD